MIGLPHLFAVGLLAASTSGCTLLDLLLGTSPFGPDESFEPFPEFSFPPLPTAETTFESGRATIEIAGAADPMTIVLDELRGEAELGTEYGTHVTWANSEGWYLSYYGYDDGSGFGGSAYITIDRIVGTEHWVVADPTRCLPTTSTSDRTGISGTAICRGLLWADFFSIYNNEGNPAPIPSQSAFDADITFEVH